MGRAKQDQLERRDDSGRVGDWVQSYTGVRFYPYDPRVEDIKLLDIAHHLSHLCRYNGAVRVFYSVAQHSVLVSDAVPAPHAVWGLLHDAAEAYIGDMVHPLKVGLPQYQEVEERLERVIAERFSLPWPMPPEVKDADLRLLMTERRDLLAVQREWGCKAEPLEQRIVPWASFDAKVRFLATASFLGVAR